MKFTAFILLFALFSINISAKPIVIYTDPSPDSKYVSIENGIIVGLDGPVNINISVARDLISVRGEISGMHSGKFKLVENNSKILFKPDVPFTFGENVRVTLNEKYVSATGRLINNYSFSFSTQISKIAWDPVRSFREELETRQPQKNYGFSPPPTGLPQISVITDNNPTPGKIFMSNIVFDPGISNTPYLLIADNTGGIYYSKQEPLNAFDFKKQPNGILTYIDVNKTKYFAMDTNFNTIDSFYCGNGYNADLHELRVLIDGSSFIMAFDPETVDMSRIVAGGDPNATVVGLIIQKLDSNKNVIFQWRSWDHFRIIDAVHENLTSYYIDYVHGNAIEVESDGNILLSSRHQDEITRINTSDGSLIWRLGGVHNQFNFVNDPLGFNYQHAIRRLPNGNIIFFDNGNFHYPSFSRAVEYSMDTVQKTVTLVWQYRHTPDIQSPAMGFAQRLDDGNTLISWGATNPTLTEVTSQGVTVLELNLPNGVYSYRTFKYPSNGAPTGVSSTSNTVPKSYSLAQNYPNPFNPSTIIKFDIVKTGHVSLFVYNELGQEVSRVVNETLTPGEYSAAFNGASLPSGVYFYRLVTDYFTSVKKMALIK